MFIKAVGAVWANCSCIKPVVIAFAIDEPAHNIIFSGNKQNHFGVFFKHLPFPQLPEAFHDNIHIVFYFIIPGIQQV